MRQDEVSFANPIEQNMGFLKESPRLDLRGEDQALLVALRASWWMRGHQRPDRCRQVASGKEGMVLISVCST